MMARQTFRAPAHNGAYQKQLRDRYRSEGLPSVPHLDLKRAEVHPVSRRLATQIILKYEWLGTMAPTTHHYGLFFGNWCAGVCCVSLSTGGNRNVAREFGLVQAEVAYLARGAMVHWAPPHANSKLVAWTCRRVARDTSAKLIIAYADTDAGEVGTVYQACNWIYIGCGEPTYQWIAPTGRVLHKKFSWGMAQTHGSTNMTWIRSMLAQGWTRQKSNPKYRYVYVLDATHTKLRACIEALRQPYPKRATSILADASPVQGEEEGAAPIVAL